MMVYNDAKNFSSVHILTDVTGDNLVDLTDVVLCYNNAKNFVSIIHP